MPRDANGVYSLPDGYLAVTGTTIQASQHNPPLEDIGAALTGSLPRSGTAPMTGPLRLTDGNASAPSIAFASDPSIGFYKSGAFIKPSTGAQIGGVFPVGIMLPYAGSTAPPGFVLCYGQSLNRVTYADLWAFAQTEIAAGSALFTNGDGSTTFGVMDLRGRGLFFNDKMGGTAANRITTAGSGIDGTKPGATGGAENVTLTTAQMPSHNHTYSDPGHTHNYTRANTAQTTAGNAGLINILGSPATSDVNTVISGIGITIQNNGGGSAHNNMPPTAISNVILYAGA